MLIPTDHPIGTKRICTDANYYQTFNRDNVNLVNLRATPIRADRRLRRDDLRRATTSSTHWCWQPDSTR